jgi:hypothetical protein
MTEGQATTPAITTYGKRSADAPKELDALSFLIGKWEGVGKTKASDSTTRRRKRGWWRRQVSATSGSVRVDGKTVVVISEAPDTWSRETYRVESHDRFTYSIDLSTDSGRSWNVGQIEMEFSRREWP